MATPKLLTTRLEKHHAIIWDGKRIRCIAGSATLELSHEDGTPITSKIEFIRPARHRGKWGRGFET